MRILIVGAGATGGAFGTLLQEAGQEVTYLVRPARAGVLRREGLRFISPSGDRTHPVQAITTQEAAAPFELVIVAVKAYALDQALNDLRPFVNKATMILPILNGMAHIQQTEKQFPGQVLGGLVKIVATLDGGAVRQMTDLTTLTIGAPGAGVVPDGIMQALAVPGVELTVSPNVLSMLWEKWAFIASAGVITCLFRGAVGKIIRAGGLEPIRNSIAELEAVAAAAGHPVSAQGHQLAVSLLTDPDSAFTSSLYRDLIAGLPHEAEHILGDFASEAKRLQIPTPLLELALIQIRASY